MNNRFLAITRCLVGVATAITCTVSRAAASITTAAEHIHDKALDLALTLADRKVGKAWERYDGSLKAIEMLRKHAGDSYDAFTAACDVRDSVCAGVIAERHTLSIR